jgi:hypothetical protein
MLASNKMLLTLASLSISGQLFAGTATATLVGLIDKKGNSGPDFSVLVEKDLRDEQVDSSVVMEFNPDEVKGYRGIFTYSVASTDDAVEVVTFQANFRGPNKSTQKWQFKLLDFTAGKWVTIANNNAAEPLLWLDISADITENPGRFINSAGQIKLLYRSSNSSDSSQLDYLALQVEGGDNDVEPRRTGSIWQPEPGLSWQIQYEGAVDTQLEVDVYNLDLFDTSEATIAALQAKGTKVICYFSAGSSENWRSDFDEFPAGVLGNNLDGWAGEKWLDVRQFDVLLPIMVARMELAASKGCDAVDPDNVDGYSNKTGFPLTYGDQLDYLIALSQEAHALGLAIGLKNNVDQVDDLVDYFDFAVNEECFQYDECDTLIPFERQGKAVFGIEYNMEPSNFCPEANGLNFDFLKKRLSLNEWRSACR